MTISAGRDDWLRYHNTILGNIFENESFHHEMAHPITQDIPEEDWKEIHPNAVYDSSSWKLLPSIPEGFFNKYCTHSISEDITSTVELLYRKDYDKRVSEDEILKRKADYLKAWYLTISDGAIDEAYWSTVQNGEIPEFAKHKNQE